MYELEVTSSITTEVVAYDPVLSFHSYYSTLWRAISIHAQPSDSHNRKFFLVLLAQGQVFICGSLCDALVQLGIAIPGISDLSSFQEDGGSPYQSLLF